MGAMQEVQCQLGLREEAVPKVKRKVFVGATEAGKKWFLKVQMAHSAALRR